MSPDQSKKTLFLFLRPKYFNCHLPFYEKKSSIEETKLFVQKYKVKIFCCVPGVSPLASSSSIGKRCNNRQKGISDFRNSICWTVNAQPCKKMWNFSLIFWSFLSKQLGLKLAQIEETGTSYKPEICITNYIKFECDSFVFCIRTKVSNFFLSVRRHISRQFKNTISIKVLQDMQQQVCLSHSWHSFSSLKNMLLWLWLAQHLCLCIVTSWYPGNRKLLKGKSGVDNGHWPRKLLFLINIHVFLNL